MGLISEVSGVFDFIKSCYDVLPVAIKLLIVSTFGGVVLIAILRSIRG